ncbi:MAG: hypothetical protein UU76_C0027G0005 [Parcubacteria group bacterium GW2011_GWC1_41_7]|nr:MAG: hypothetical protein UU76_C0027G0005 [Parcubacteria group bacterium GW2011_GWC1_41_7]
MEQKNSLFTVTAVIVLLLVAAFFVQKLGMQASLKQVSPITVQVATSTSLASSITDMIEVVSPLGGSTVLSPLVVSGRARGNWYFEASFPIKLIDASGTEIAVGIAQAKGDWMTEDWVDFEALLNFTNPKTATGTLLLMKDNPSGMPENDAKLDIPVLF